MSIRVQCDCGKAFRVADEHAGKNIRCPGCQQPVRVPIPALDAIDTSELDDDDPEPEPRPIPSVGASKVVSRLADASTSFELAVLARLDRMTDRVETIERRLYWILFIMALPFYIAGAIILFYVMIFAMLAVTGAGYALTQASLPVLGLLATMAVVLTISATPWARSFIASLFQRSD